jgi:hypothetical protein
MIESVAIKPLHPNDGEWANSTLSSINISAKYGDLISFEGLLITDANNISSTSNIRLMII